VLTLTAALVDEMIAHAREQHPIEACGVIAGPAASDRPTRLLRMRNTLESTTAFQFDPTEQMAAYRQMDARGEDPIVIYHSHTASPAYPSGTDTRLALNRDACYAIISTADPEQPEIRFWRLTGPDVFPWSEEGAMVEDTARRWQWPSVSAYLASAGRADVSRTR
jgi:[CysO sulfur-carrier protein]-S-L-cysteine hydrolase